jgi:CBS domain containing-hemolysin-like protein
VLAEVPKYIAVLLLARVAAELGATLLVTWVLLHWSGPSWRPFLLAGGIMTAVIYVVAGIVPRTLGRQYAAGVADTAASVMQPVVRLMGPIPALLLAIGRILGRGGSQESGPSGEEEDLRGLVDLLERRRVIEPGERAMIHSVFELGDTIVREVMVPRTDMIFVENGKTLRQALSLALRSGFSRIPVVGENLDDVVGIAYLKDIVTRTYEFSDGPVDEPVTSVMRPATFVPDSKPVDDLLREMQARQTHVAIVIDEYGGTAGLVTIEDILEEIVGEIADEYDREQPPVEWLGDGHARVTARLSVDELAELFDVRIEVEDVETVGGLLAQRLGRVPIAGSTARVAGLRLTAESLAGRRNRISTVTVCRVSEDGTGRDGAGQDGAIQVSVGQDGAQADQPEETQPEGTQPEVTRPEVTRPEVTRPEIAQPEGTQPASAQLANGQPTDVAEPGSASRDSHGPVTAGPESPRPDAAAQDAAGQGSAMQGAAGRDSAAAQAAASAAAAREAAGDDDGAVGSGRDRG